MQLKRFLPGLSTTTAPTFAGRASTTGGGASAAPAVLLILLGLCGGCSGGGSNTPATYSIFPQQLPGGNTVSAEQTLTFSGSITNSTSRAPRFIVEKNEDFTYDAAHDPVLNPDVTTAPDVTPKNYPHGTIDPTSGVYTAPKWLPANPDGKTVTNDTVDVVSSDTYDRFTNIILSIRQKLQTNRTDYDGNPSDRVIADVIASERLNPTVHPGSPATDAGKAQAKQLADDALGRLAYDLSPRDKTSTIFAVVHKVVDDPETSVSIRTQMRLASTVRVLGDPLSNDNNSRNVTYEIIDKALGAGGDFSDTTGRTPAVSDMGIYVAPATVPDQARDTDHPNPRRGYDIVRIKSKADPLIYTDVKVIIASGAAGGVTVN